ncbi:murein transglycosylase [Chania multitudinisentens RB-25]|uniref:Membrane-bound lytic murein transglycosylase F n=1 Tax=Chania multitudinisentens RB-25 TaxID=1441930 RepID=W0LAR2_9GAMM|nr:membrane-bound lytic murein transglycosylase MltF [Chania multitudinisentens]AHG19070.1 murein transglycosylase [Chania multitudinisentens RB-25]
MKPIKTNYILIGVVTLLLALALWPNISWRGGLGNQLEAIKSRGELRVSTLNAPLTYVTTQQGPSGLDYELVKSFANYLGVKLAVTPHQNINDLFDDLHDGKADLLAAGLIYNPERLSRANTGPAYYSVSQQVVYRLGTSRPKTFADMQGKLAVASGSAQASALKQLKQNKYPNLSWEASSDLTAKELLEQVADGQLDYTLADSVTIALLQRIHPQLAVAFDVSDEEPVTWYLKRNGDSSLHAAMLDFYSQIVEDGTLARLEEKYLGHVGSFDYVDTKTFLSAIDTVLPNFRSLFEKHANEIDWQLLAAIAYQESHWNPLATSPTGVRGLMMLTRPTAEGLGVNDRLDPEESIQGGALYLQRLMAKVPESVPEDERIWFALAAYNMGWGHMLDVRKLTKSQQGNPDRWVDVKQRLPMLSQKRYYPSLTYGYARGHEAYNYVENIRRYHVSLVGYLQEKEKKAALEAKVSPEQVNGYPAVNARLALNF